AVISLAKFPMEIPTEFSSFFFFFNDTATTEIYTTRHTLSLHDALPTSAPGRVATAAATAASSSARVARQRARTRSEEHTSELQSRLVISYAVFCLKKKKRIECRSSTFVVMSRIEI